jgi:tetratricopeptide (TPR) repeat protein
MKKALYILLFFQFSIFNFQLIFAQGDIHELRSGNRYYQRGKFDTAATHYRRILDVDSNDFAGQYNLGNALYRADHAAWEEISAELSEDVVRDLSARNAYWRQFETPVQKASNTVYEGFLHSYDQTLGLKSYGACVDLLVNYYCELSLTQDSA